MSKKKEVLFQDEFEIGYEEYILPNGEKYYGELKDGRCHGQGTITFKDGSKYLGEWKDGEYHGQGTETLPNGDKYVGEFKDG